MEQQKRLDSFVLKNYRSQTLTIVGYTDSVGTNLYNISLSQKRAETIKKYLSPSFKTINIVMQYLGETINEKTDAENRKVEIYNYNKTFEKTITKNESNIKQRYSFDKIYFYANTAILKPESSIYLEELYKNVLKAQGERIEIRGHINWPLWYGKFEPTNTFKELSANRAKAIYNYLKDRKINMTKISYRGMDNTEMVFPNAKTDEEMAKNMRVEIVLLKE